MKFAFLVTGTPIIGSLLGALVAFSTPSAPVQRAVADSPWGEPANFEDQTSYQTSEYGPDHYPLTTRSGTLAVEDLWKRRPQHMRPFDFALAYPDELPDPAAYPTEVTDDERDVKRCPTSLPWLQRSGP